jgi:hypothetical protein
MTSELEAALAANRAAVDELATVAESAASRWTVPRAEGKWSPSRLVEHVARAMDASADEVLGRPSGLPTIPSLLRPLIRRLVFRRVLRTGTFMKSKTVRAMDPESGPASATEARARLEAALARFDDACRARTPAGGIVTSGAFGRVTLADYARFQALHTRHHCRQLTS